MQISNFRKKNLQKQTCHPIPGTKRLKYLKEYLHTKGQTPITKEISLDQSLRPKKTFAALITFHSNTKCTSFWKLDAKCIKRRMLTNLLSFHKIIHKELTLFSFGIYHGTYDKSKMTVRNHGYNFLVIDLVINLLNAIIAPL